MQISDYIDDLVRATGFLSRLPMPARNFEGHDGSLNRASGTAPAAGLVIALCPGWRSCCCQLRAPMPR
jgi:adenosylcobinamide-GDP ribazoletransferase